MGTRYQNVRLSKHFLLMDFMYGWEVYASRLRLPFDEVVSEENLRTGRGLCDVMLEPMVAMYGPCSVAFGLLPQKAADHHRWTDYRPRPHRWVDRFGAAVDVCFHDQAHAGIAPVDLCFDWARDHGFERLITYGGSEFICVNWKNGTDAQADLRFAFYENERIPGRKPKFRNVAVGRQQWERLTVPAATPLAAWQREEDEKPGNSRLRAQHIRVGRYFTLLDFCRSEVGLAAGLNPVPHKLDGQEAQVARMFAEVLDPFVEEVGRVSVVKGIQPPTLARHPGNRLFNWGAEQETYQVKLVLPQDNGRAAPTSLRHPAIESVEWFEHPSDSIELVLTIRAFDPIYQRTVGYVLP